MARIFGYTPDGSAPILERLSWATDISISSNGKEERRRLRARPRYRYEYTLAATDEHANGYAGLLADLRSYEGDWLLPLWPHATPAPDVPAAGLSPTVGALSFSAQGAASIYSGQLTGEVVPAGIGRIVEARRIEHATDAFAFAKLAFELLNHDEAPQAYPVDGEGLAVFDFPADWASGTAEDLTPDENRVDYGGLWAAETRYRTRTLSVRVCLFEPEQIARFRAFLFHVQGAFRAFRATVAPDITPALWRLNSDNIELLHEGNTLTCALSFKQL